MAKQNTKLAEVFHFDLYGKREEKYEFLNQNSIASINWNKLEPNEPNFFLVKKNFDEIVEYEKGFKVDELFSINTSGVKTHNDSELVSFNKFIENNQKYTYKLFDNRNINYDLKKVQRHRFSIMKNMLKDNYGLCLMRGLVDTVNFSSIYITKYLLDINFYRFQTYLFPLYIYPETTSQQTIGHSNERTPNLNAEIVNQIAVNLGLTFTDEKETTPNTFAPIDILDYIYAVLHSPTYREKYKEFLKIDFPRIPYPKNTETFWQLVKLGGEIRQIHLLESPTVEKYITQYPIDGDNVVIKPNFQNGKVYINDTQYFDNVPEVAWNFYIGGYQPAQKWLKDRKDRKLEFEEILHYQKIIVALSETDRLMKEIDKIEIE